MKNFANPMLTQRCTTSASLIAGRQARVGRETEDSICNLSAAHGTTSIRMALVCLQHVCPGSNLLRFFAWHVLIQGHTLCAGESNSDHSFETSLEMSLTASPVPPCLLSGAKSLLSAVPIVRRQGSPPLWLRLEWNTLDMEEVLALCQTLRQQRGLIVDVPQAGLGSSCLDVACLCAVLVQENLG